MASTKLSLDNKGFNELTEAMQNYSDYAGEVVNEVLWDEGGALIAESIQRLLPESGRHWRGKKQAAKQAAPFTQTNEPLAVTVRSKSAYNYLYFPDDGSTTRKHAGNQQFMLRGAEEKQDEIINLCIVRLTKI